MMVLPEKLPGLRGAMFLLMVTTAVWISLEGALWQVMVMGVGTTAVLLGYGVQRLAGGRSVSVGWWLGGTAVGGLLFGLGSGALTLLFMVMKTGLHAHGPEFTPAEIAWVVGQTPLWALVGLLAGVGLGLVAVGLRKS